MDLPSDKAIVNLASSWDIGGEIVKALGLERVADLTLVFKRGKPVEAHVTHLVEEPAGEAIAKAFVERAATYRLVRDPVTRSEFSARIAELQAQLAETRLAAYRLDTLTDRHSAVGEG